MVGPPVVRTCRQGDPSGPPNTPVGSTLDRVLTVIVVTVVVVFITSSSLPSSMSSLLPETYLRRGRLLSVERDTEVSDRNGVDVFIIEREMDLATLILTPVSPSFKAVI